MFIDPHSKLPRSIFSCAPSWLNLHKSTENRIGPDPPIDVSAVVADLKSAALDRLDEMQVLGPSNFAEHDIEGAKVARIHWLDGAKLTRFYAR